MTQARDINKVTKVQIRITLIMKVLCWDIYEMGPQKDNRHQHGEGNR